MLVAAKGRGYKCVGVSDHSRGAGKGLKPESVLSYASELRAQDVGLRVLVGLELDVRITQELDCPASYLGHLDYVILATHAEPDRDVLARLAAGVDAVRAVYPRMPLVFAHPSNRLLGERRPADIDWKSFFHLCAAKNVAIEINGQGRRLDLDDSHVRVGSQYKCRFLCSSDAHSTEQLSNMDNAVVAARRGLLERSSVINTSVSRLQGWLDGRDLRKMR
jgi:DNA polymerase (family 10)